MKIGEVRDKLNKAKVEGQLRAAATARVKQAWEAAKKAADDLREKLVKTEADRDAKRAELDELEGVSKAYAEIVRAAEALLPIMEGREELIAAKEAVAEADNKSQAEKEKVRKRYEEAKESAPSDEQLDRALDALKAVDDRILDMKKKQEEEKERAKIREEMEKAKKEAANLEDLKNKTVTQLEQAAKRMKDLEDRIAKIGAEAPKSGGSKPSEGSGGGAPARSEGRR